jgi:hypothetical protein
MEEIMKRIQLVAHQAVADARDPSQLLDAFERILALDPADLPGFERVAAHIALEVLHCRARRAIWLLQLEMTRDQRDAA